MSDIERQNDAELVAAFRAGQQAAFGAIYDRYAGRIYSYCLTMLRDPKDAADASHDAFVKAATRIDRLGDPGKLRPWLFSMARTETRAEGRHQSKVTPGGHIAETRVGLSGSAADNEKTGLRTLVWEAMDGLGQRDQELMALHLTEGLEGEDLAQAMGVDMEHLPVLVSRMRNRVEKALGAVLITQLGHEDCDELGLILGDWDGEFDSDVRARVTRHVGSCEICHERRATLLTPGHALARIMIAAAPASLRSQVLVEVAMGEEPPPPPQTVRIGGALGDGAKLGVFALVTLLLGLLGLAVSAQFEPLEIPEGTVPPVANDTTTTSNPANATTTIQIGTTAPDSNTTQPATPGTIEVSTETIDFGEDANTAQIDIANSGGQTISFALEPSVETIVLSAGGQELDPGESVTYDVLLDRETVAEGEIDESIAVTWDGGNLTIAISAIQMDNPILHNPQASPAQVEVSGSPDCSNTTTTISVRVRDRSPLQNVVVQWSPDGGSNRETAMTDIGGDIYEADIGPFTTVHTAAVRVVATDELGNAGGATIEVPVLACP